MVNFPLRDKFIIYQVLPRLFGNVNENCAPYGSIDINGCGKFCDFDFKTLKSIKELGCTHIWFTGILEHSTKTDYSGNSILPDFPSLVKGEAGSPFAIKDYYDVDPDLATNVSDRISEFKDLIVRTHKEGIKVIIDFIPNHVARYYYSDTKPADVKDFGENDKKDYSFDPMNNFYYLLNEHFRSPKLSINGEDCYVEFPAKVTGNDCFSSKPSLNDWFETVKLNYGIDYLNNRSCYFNPVPDTWKKMQDILFYWLKMGVDGFRCDMAEMVPVEFWKFAIDNVKKQFPDALFIAEIYSPEQYSNYLNNSNFDYIYDKVGLYDTLRQIIRGEAPASKISTNWQSLGDNQDRMLNFLENHDEQRIASDFFICDPFLAIPALTVSLMFNKTPFMLYFGQELGEKGMDAEGFSGVDGRTSIFDYWSLGTVRRWRLTNIEPQIRVLYRKFMNLAVNETAFKKGQTYDLGYLNEKSLNYDPDCIFSFLRCHDRELILVVVNFSNCEKDLLVKIPQHSFDYFNIKYQKINSGLDLLTGDTVNEPFWPDNPYFIKVQGNNTRIIKFSLQ